MHLPLPHTKNICQFISSKIEENICENVFEDIGLGRKKRISDWVDFINMAAPCKILESTS